MTTSPSTAVEAGPAHSRLDGNPQEQSPIGSNPRNSDGTNHDRSANGEFSRLDGAEIWLGLTRQEQAEIGAIAIELVATWRLQRRVYEDQLGDVLQRAADAADHALISLLDGAVVDVLPDGALEAEDCVTPRVPSLLGGICRDCGCTEADAWPGGCGWACDDLCTTCAAENSPPDGGQDAAPNFDRRGVRTMAEPFTAADKLRCADRELRQRHRVYPRLVENGRMTQAEANCETACMAAIAADYRARASAEKPDLFTGMPEVRP